MGGLEIIVRAAYAVMIVALPAGGSRSPGPATQDQPSIVFILADDMGWANVGWHNPYVKTPQLNALAAGGVTLDRYYVQPICSPTRSVLMTGRYTFRLGTQAEIIESYIPFGVALKEKFMSQHFQEAGYRTALFGKWSDYMHLGFYQRAFTPLGRGFDEHLGYFTGVIDYYSHLRSAAMGNGASVYNWTSIRTGVDWHRGNGTTCLADDGNYTEPLIVASAVEFIQRQAIADLRFFLYLPFHLIHAPNQVPDRFLKMYPTVAPASNITERVCAQDKDWDWSKCRIVLAMASALDSGVGEILSTLKATEVYDKSIIVFSSDNGAQQGQGGSNHPLRGWKAQLYDGGMRVPGFVHSALLPVAARGTVSEKLFHVSDWLPTLLNRCGGNTDGSLPLDGLDIWAALTEQTTPSPRTSILHNFNSACGRGKLSLSMPNSAIQLGGMKLLVECFNKTLLAPNPNSFVELYDIERDPYETADLSKKKPAVTKRLLAALAEYVRSADQVPPTLKPTLHTESGSIGFNGSTSWNYQCPQCPVGGGMNMGANISEREWNVWCEEVVCVPEQCDALYEGNACRA